MKVKCISVKVKSPDLEYYIKLDKEYIIYGISIYEDRVNYLICDEFDSPDWYDAELFRVSNNLLPVEWYYKFYGDDFYLRAIFGYKELIFDSNHYDNTLECEKKDLDIFYKRKKEIDEYEDLNSPIKKEELEF